MRAKRTDRRPVTWKYTARGEAGRRVVSHEPERRRGGQRVRMRQDVARSGCLLDRRCRDRLLAAGRNGAVISASVGGVMTSVS